MADADRADFFGKTPPRALETFGVAGVLGEKSKVFYSSIFTTKHIGRVSDLIAAKLSSEGLDELRLRALLLFGAFEVFRSQGSTAEGTSKLRLAEPLVLECGLDEDRIALGVSFTTDEERFPKFEGLVERITEGKPEGVFEELLAQIHSQSHWTVLRGQPAIRRLEIVMVLGLPGKIDAETLNAKPTLKIVEIPKEQKAEPPKVKAYIELGDLDYPELLKEDVSVKDTAAPATGEVLMHGLKELDDAVKVRASDLLQALATTKVGGGESDDGSVVVKGKGDEQDAGFKITNGGAIQATDGALLVKGSGAAAQPGGYALKSYGVPPAPGDEQGAGYGSGAAAGSAPTESEEEGEESEESSNRIKDVIDKVKSAWPFRFGKGNAEDEEEAPAETEASAAKPAPAPAPEAKAEAASEAAKKPEAAVANDDDGDSAPIPASQPIKISTADIEKEAQKLTREIETGIEKTVTRAQSEAGDLKKEMGSTRAKRWVDGLMTELVAEKARLAEGSKALNASIRQKEIEFRNKEQILTEELKRRDDMIRQKTNALNRAKDQLSQAAISAERLKAAKAGATDDAHYKQKYGLIQKMLNSAKDENTELNEKIEDLKNQLMSSQLTAKRSGPSMTDFTALQSKYERSIRQADEFKKTNQQLLDKLAEAKKEKIGSTQDDPKKRLEAAMKMATNYQRDAEKLQTRVEEMQREQMRLHSELTKTTQELKASRLATTKAAATSEAAAKAAAKPTPAALGKSVAGAKPVAAAKPVASAKPAAAAAAKPATPTAGKPNVPASAAKPAPAKPAAPGVAAAPAQAAAAAKPAAAATAPKLAAVPPAKPAQPAAAKPGTGGKSNPPKAA